MLSMDLRCVLLCCVLAGGGMTMGGQGETPKPKSKSQGESSRSRQETRESQKSARDLVKREGENRPDDAMTFEILGRPMVLTGEVETRTRFRAGLGLDQLSKDRDFDTSLGAELECLYLPAPTLSVFLETKIRESVDVGLDGEDDNWSGGVFRGESWLHWRPSLRSPWSVQAGRTEFHDGREWWWDDLLDSVRMKYEGKDWTWELGVGEEMFPEDLSEKELSHRYEKVLWTMGRVAWDLHSRHRLEAFATLKWDHSSDMQERQVVTPDQRDEVDDRLLWVGLRYTGRTEKERWGRLRSWVDLGGVVGQSIVLDYDSIRRGGRTLYRVDHRYSMSVGGWALDLGTTWEAPEKGWPRVTLGYAYGSGDMDSKSGLNRGFRQTGLHKNNGRFRGVNRFRYYGELLRPDLGNMHLTTLGIGMDWLKNSSLELLWHTYFQDQASRTWEDSALTARAGGKRTFLGQEWDLVVGLEEWKRWELECVASVFVAGDAFEKRSGRAALGLTLQVEYNF